VQIFYFIYFVVVESAKFIYFNFNNVVFSHVWDEETPPYVNVVVTFYLWSQLD